jgi:3-isopropylmalate/(R)-2-methylmalate dehydratase small subunit
MRSNRPEFAGAVQRGDIVVAGKNFGCGSARPAVVNLITLGVSCVIAESFSRIFFRSSISLGFPLLECKGLCDVVNEGDRLQANLETAELKNLTTGEVLKAQLLPEVMMKILAFGGTKALLKAEYGRQ